MPVALPLSSYECQSLSFPEAGWIFFLIVLICSKINLPLICTEDIQEVDTFEGLGHFEYDLMASVKNK